MNPSILVRSDVEPVDPSIVQLFVSINVTRKYFDVALLTVLVYHSIITIDKEVKYFWANPLNTVGLSYFANRYVGILGAIFPIILNGFNETLAICQSLIWAQEVANLITIVLMDYILLIRVLAFYNQIKMLGICLKVLLALEAAVELCILINDTLFEEVIVASITEDILVCAQHRNAPVALRITSWLIPLAYGLLLLILALYKVTGYWRLSSGRKGSHLVTVLIQDQVMYYGFVVIYSVIGIVNIGTFDINPFASFVLNAVGSPTILCIVGGQLLINLKEAGERGINEEANYRQECISTIQFA